MMNSKSQNEERNRRSLSLEFVAEIITTIQMMIPLVQRLHSSGPENVMTIFARLGNDPEGLEKFWSYFDHHLKEGISLASILLCIDEETRMINAEKKIFQAYAMSRLMFYDIYKLLNTRPPFNPRYDSSLEEPYTTENKRLLDYVWGMVQHMPVVKEEMSRQEDLVRWKRIQGKKATKRYTKVRDRIKEKFEIYQAELRETLFSKEKSENHVNTPK